VPPARTALCCIRLFDTVLHIMYNYVCNGTIVQARTRE
jgi:hypothetical protein